MVDGDGSRLITEPPQTQTDQHSECGGGGGGQRQSSWTRYNIVTKDRKPSSSLAASPPILLAVLSRASMLFTFYFH